MTMKNVLWIACLALFALGCTSSSTPFYGNADGETGLSGDALQGEADELEGNTGGGSKVTGVAGGNHFNSPDEPGGAGSESGDEEGTAPGSDEAAEDCTEDAGAFGCPCTSNEDCDTGWCVSGLNGNVCTKPCLENCPEGWTCQAIQNLGGDLIYVCVPVVPELCLACAASSECGSEIDLCLEVGGSTVCGADCDKDSDCPEGYGCQNSTSVEGEERKQCVSVTGSCECTPDVNGLVVACTVENQAGKCFGEKTCQGAEGWSSARHRFQRKRFATGWITTAIWSLMRDWLANPVRYPMRLVRAEV